MCDGRPFEEPAREEADPAVIRWLRKCWWAATAVVALGIGLGVFLARPTHPARALPPTRARVYTAFDACLLTDAAGVGSAQAAPVWSGMQAASVQSSGKVSFLSSTARIPRQTRCRM